MDAYPQRIESFHKDRWKSNPDLWESAPLSGFGRPLSAVNVDSTIMPSVRPSVCLECGGKFSTRKTALASSYATHRMHKDLIQKSNQTTKFHDSAEGVIHYLEHELNGIVNELNVSLDVDWDHAADAMDRLMLALSYRQDDLNQFFSDGNQRAQVFSYFIQRWQTDFYNRLQQ